MYILLQLDLDRKSFQSCPFSYSTYLLPQSQTIIPKNGSFSLQLLTCKWLSYEDMIASFYLN